MINYPNNIKKNINNKIIKYNNRGMMLETMLNNTNKYYLENNIAVVHKKPTPVKVLKQTNGKIVDGYFEMPSTTDYNGVYKGKYIDFEAKETILTTNFPLSNIKEHQIGHMYKVYKQQGICFIIVMFSKLNKIFLLFSKDLFEYLENNTKKSIPLNYFEEKGHLINIKLKPEIDYIEIIKKFGEM
jgi:recombination protein U